MLSFRQFLTLLEGKADDFRQRFPHLSDLSDKHILKYGSKLARMSDLPTEMSKVKNTLDLFDRHGPNLEKKDFHKYGSWGEVGQALSPVIQKKLDDDKPASKSIFKGDTLSIERIDKHDPGATKYCDTTHWCVTGKGKVGQEYWKKYSEGGKNKMYVIHGHDGQKFAYHEGEDGIARDVDDKTVNIKDLVQRYPELQKSKHIMNSRYGYKFGNARKAEEISKRGDIEDKKIMAKDKDWAHLLVGDENEDVRQIVAKHPEHAGKLIDGSEPPHVREPSHKVRVTIASHPEHAGKLVNDPISGVRMIVARHPEHAGKLIDGSEPPHVREPDQGVRVTIASHPEHAGKLVNDPNEYVRKTVAYHPEHAPKLVNDPHPDVAREAQRTVKMKADLDNLSHELSGIGT